jgi:aminocarboxymuconate-semialdehyde decarboxylase
MITRRDMLAGSAAALFAGPLDTSAQTQFQAPTPGPPPATRVKVIDIHAHWYPQKWLDLVERESAGNGAIKIDRNPRGLLQLFIPGLTVTFQPRYTDIPSRLKAMDAQGVTMHAMSLTQPMVYWAEPAFGLKLSQAFNDACAALHLIYPERFVGLATLPMQAPELAVLEVERAAKLLGIRGVYMSTHVLGKNLDEREFWPVYAKCEALGLPIFLHPTNTLGADRMGRYYLRNFIGNPTESAIAAGSLMFSGVLDAHPKLDVVLPHSGGTFPILIGRWDHGATVRQEVKDLKSPPSHYLRRFHYDTVAHNREILMNLVRQVGADRVVCGTDFPADMAVGDPVHTVEALTELPERDRDLILRRNAARLLKLDA